MKINILGRLLAITALILFLYNGTVSAEQRRVALVIGNSSYHTAALEHPANDAEDMAKALEKCGFKVERVINADREKMHGAIEAFVDAIIMGGAGLFYYAGFGVQVNGENYLVPIGVDLSDDAKITDECLMVSPVLKKIESAGNDLNIIIMDAFYGNPFSQSAETVQAGLGEISAPKGSFLAYTAAPGSTVSDATGRNSLYASVLLKYLKSPDLNIQDVFKYIQIDVRRLSRQQGREQSPWEISSLTDDFYFTSKNSSSVINYLGLVVDKEQEQPEQGREEISNTEPKAEENTHDKTVPGSKCKEDAELAFLIGVWEDSDGHSFHEITFTNRIYRVASVIDDDGEVYEMRDSRCQNGKLIWTIHVPSTGYITEYELLLPSSSATILKGFASNDHGIIDRRILFKKRVD